MKASRAAYMRLRRKKITVQSNGKMLQCNAADLLHCNKILLLCNAEDAEKMLQCNDMMLQCNAALLQCNAEDAEKMLQCNASKNMKSGEISSKTPFSGKNCDNHVSRGGEGGGSLNNNTSIPTLSDKDVTRETYSKEKNTKKRKENSLKSSVKHLELYENFPRKKGKLKGLESLAKFEKAGELPELGYLLAALEIQKKQWDSEGRELDKIPYFSTWVNRQEWSDIPESKIRAHIARGQPRETPPEAKPAQTLASARLPAMQEWIEMGSLENSRLAQSLGCAAWDITQEIARRAKL